MCETQKLVGRCHCGALHAEIELSKPASQIELRACQCSFCSRHNGKTFTDPESRFVLYSADGKLKRYRMGLGVAEFLICNTCGIYVAAVMETRTGLLATVNASGLGLAAFSAHDITAVDYDGETADARRERRVRGWTPTELVMTTGDELPLKDCA